MKKLIFKAVSFFRKQTFLILFIAIGFNVAGQKSVCLETKAISFVNNLKESELEKILDKNGNLLVFSETNFSNNIKSFSKKTVNEYDFKNRLVKTISYINDIEISQSTKQYDSPDFLIKESVNQNTQIVTKSSNNAIEKTYLDQNGNQSAKEITQINIVGNITNKTVLDNKNQAISEISKKYDFEEKLIESINNDIAAKIKIKTQFEYNAEGNILKETEYLNEEFNFYTINQYQGNRISKKTKYNKNSQIEYQLEYQYDLFGNLNEERYFYNSELISTKKYSFDAQNKVILETNINKENKITKQIFFEYKNCN